MTNIIEIFKTGGVALLFVAALLWVIRYFMAQVDKFTEERRQLQSQFDEVLSNHLDSVVDTMTEQRHQFELLMQTLDTLIERINVLIEKLGRSE